MKFSSVLASLSVLLAGVSAQFTPITFVAPAFDSQVTAGVPFNVTVQLQTQPTDFIVVALYFGRQPGGDPTNEALGDEVVIVPTPDFQSTGPLGQLQLNVPITIQDTGLTNVTLGAFFVSGAVKIPGTSVTKTRVQVVS
ncbi:hypothetical protein Clacol_001280 [Clathrus columnatus]|uniref:Uncharacterized protein n=1 Tax=Clathrus columnatus TaxID=1419009 RepID=A0AAV4ZXZ1_9AGAM|nr:hypothetical protein Clacol_001280 [Clathrus columnatus]